jgi:hypothetical protein
MPQLHLTFWPLLFWMVVAHCYFDYPGQGDFLSMLKNHTHKVGEKYWMYGLVSHGMIHAGAVAFLTGHISLGLLELLHHCVVDRLKCSGRLSYHMDQWQHILAKVLWAVFAVFVVWS